MHLSVVIKLLKIGREHQNLSMNVSSLIVILSVMYKIEVAIAPIKTENFWISVLVFNSDLQFSIYNNLEIFINLIDNKSS